MNTQLLRQAATCLAGTILTLSLEAGPRTSASYSVVTDIADAGGKRSTSASYTNDGSAGGIAGVSTVAVPAETTKAGYIGQLFEVTALQIAAAPPTVNEAATRQLSATQVLDDLTTIAVPAASVAWTVQSGPLTGINTAGLASAGTVFENTAASARGIFAGQSGTLGLTVLNTLPDNFGTYAGDGLDDVWQNQFFGLNNPLAAAGADPDSDGSNNAAEFNAQTDPTSGASFFLPTNAVSGGNLTFSFPTVAGRTYTLQGSGDLAPASWTTSGLPAALPGNGAVRTFTLPVPSSRQFFRIQIGP